MPDGQEGLDLHDLFLFMGNHLINLGHMAVGDILDLFFSALQIVFSNFFVLLQLFQLIDGIATDVADRDLWYPLPLSSAA